MSVDWLAPLGQSSPALAVIGSITSIAAFAMAITALRQSLAYTSHIRKEHAHNIAYMRRMLRGCLDTID